MSDVFIYLALNRTKLVEFGLVLGRHPKEQTFRKILVTFYFFSSEL